MEGYEEGCVESDHMRRFRKSMRLSRRFECCLVLQTGNNSRQEISP